MNKFDIPADDGTCPCQLSSGKSSSWLCRQVTSFNRIPCPACATTTPRRLWSSTIRGWFRWWTTARPFDSIGVWWKTMYLLEVADVELKEAYVDTVEHCFANAVRKWFFALLASFLLNVREHNLEEKMLKSCYSTNPKGVHLPGAFELKYVTRTRQVEQGSTIKTDIHNKVADFVLYDANLCRQRAEV